MQRLLLTCVLVLGACAGDSPDAPSNGEFGAACTAVTDTGSTECTSGVCSDTFDQITHPVCSQKCTYGMNDTCPPGADGMKRCNKMGYCRP